MGRVVHFEVFTDDVAGSAEFYRRVLGWDITAWEGPMEYHLATTGPVEVPGIDGAFAPSGDLGQTVVLTAEVDDIDAAIGRAVTAGATLLSDKADIPEVGAQAYLRDPAGTVFSLLQPVPMPEGAAVRDVWTDIGESLKQFGDTVAVALSEAAASPHAQRAREEGERALRGIRDASATAADKARPHVISALDRVSLELGDLASRLRREEAEPPLEPEKGDESYTPPPIDEC